MEKIAVIKTGGKQYKVSEGDVLKVEKLEGENLEFADLLGNKKVKAKVTGEGKRDKVEIFKFRRKKHYQRRTGHRQSYSEITIESIV